MSDQLIMIRCPFNRTTKTGKTIPCGHPSVRVRAGSSGEAYCTRCKRTYEFDVSKNPAQQLVHD
jgi:uncharacterized Zn-finger protein